MLLAFDDTDSAAGGCTTHMLLPVLARLEGLVPRALPRLVRLNPNIPWKTRGNAAVCVPLGVQAGPQVRAGEWRGMELRVYPEAAPVGASQLGDVADAAWEIVSGLAQPDASPAVAAFAEPPPSAAYWQAVRTVVEPAEARAMVEAEGGVSHSRGEGRALIGCLAAAAWPGPPSSYEFTAYREPRHWGTARQLDARPFKALDASGATFHSWDPEGDRPTCIPKTPCPVLCGLRGRDPDTLALVAGNAIARAALEPVDAWILWATNQGSGDHVTPVATVDEAPIHGTLQVAATVEAPAEDMQGAHVVVPLSDVAGEPFEAVAFEPTHRFRRIVRALRPGDAVTVVGAWGRRGLRLEKLEVRTLAAQERKTSNPVCPQCGRTMKSRGTDAGYRCADCGVKAPAGSAVLEPVERDASLPGWHEVPVMARRHLHRPLAWEAKRTFMPDPTVVGP